MRYFIEHETKHTHKFGRRIFKVMPEYNNAIEYAYAKDVAENYDRARWFGFNAEMPHSLEVCSLGTAAALGV